MFVRASLALLVAVAALVFGQAPLDNAKLKESERLWSQSSQLSREGRLAEAIVVARSALGVERGILGEEDPRLAASVHRLAELCQRAEDYVGAETAFREVLDRQTNRFGKHSWQATNSRLDFEHVQRLARLDGKSRQELKQAEEWLGAAQGADASGKYEQGAELAEKALAINIRLLGTENRQTALSASWAGVLWDRSGQFKKARPHYENALAANKNILGQEHPETVLSLNNLGNLLIRNGDLVAARPYVEGALRIRLKLFGDNHADTAQSLHSLGLLLIHQDDFTGARPLLERALSIHRNARGEDADTAWYLSSLGDLCLRTADYAVGRRCYDEALAICKKVFGEHHRDTARPLNNLAALLESQGEYAAAHKHYEQALAVCNKALGPDHADTALCLNNLGSLLVSQGDLEAARPYFERALAVQTKVFGEHHLETAVTVQNLGYVAFKKKDYGTSRKHYGHALAIRQKVSGEHTATARSFLTLGELLHGMGEFREARAHYDQALAIQKKLLLAEHPERAETLHQLGVLLHSQGDMGAAQAFFEEALNIRRKVLGPNHPETAETLDHLGVLLQTRGDTAEARTLLEQALAASRRSLELAAVAQSERQQLLMSAKLRYQFQNYMNLPGESARDHGAAYAHVLTWKGLVLARQLRLRLERQNSQFAPLLADLRMTSSQLARLALSTPDASRHASISKKLEELSERKEKLERELTQQSQSFRQDYESRTLTAEKLAKLLPPDTVLVDFVIYGKRETDSNKKGPWTYKDHVCAFVLRPGVSLARLELGPMAPIEAAIDEWRGLTKTHDIAGKAHPGLTLRALLWHPLERHLVGAKTVLLAPDGALARLPFAALPGAAPGSYLLEEMPISVVPVPRLLPDILRVRIRLKPVQPSLLLVGDIDFDAGPGKADDGSRTAPAVQRTKEKKWPHLPGTRGEILAIRDSFERRFAAGKISILRGDQATEKSLRDLGPKHSLLHVATHGFFASAQVPSALNDDVGQPQRGDRFGNVGVTGFHPGLLSGLVFAGANQTVESAQADGILTALEIAELDLRSIELGVLSACETGLGRVAAGEGVLGLQRAFQVAGARSIVSSLWSVDDESTRKLMERFYENLWQKKLSKEAALRQAQIAMLRGELVRGIERVPDGQPLRVRPHYWAAFVLSGDWR